jgi:hypothetical protein
MGKGIAPEFPLKKPNVAFFRMYFFNKLKELFL